MSILSSLARAYDRLSDAPPFGFSLEKIGFCISLNDDGTVAHLIDLRDMGGRKPQLRQMLVPQPVKRTAGIVPNTFWDKTSYVLGVTAGNDRRTADEHAEFARHHLNMLKESEDPGLRALRGFLKNWTPEQFSAPKWPEDMKDKNVIFALESERLKGTYLHDRLAARSLWRDVQADDQESERTCLMTGETDSIARLHPSVKGVWGAQSSGASLVSFNLDAFTSYGHEQGENAPVSVKAAFAYTTILNRFLENDSGHRIQIGDASTVFWADASDMKAAELVEGLFAAYIDPKDQEANEEEAVIPIGLN